MYGIADFDPDGLAILDVYRVGSIALAHEGEALQCASLRWLGLRSEHVVLAEGTHARQGLLTLSPRDRAKARKMLERAVETDRREEGDGFDVDGADGIDRRAELQRMMMLGVKAELQLLDAVPGGMEDLLEGALGGLRGYTADL